MRRSFECNIDLDLRSWVIVTVNSTTGGLWPLVTCRNLQFRQVCWLVRYVRLYVCLSVCGHSSVYSLALNLSKFFVTIPFHDEQTPVTFGENRNKTFSRKNLGKLENRLSLTWGQISKIHNFGKSRDNRFQFRTCIGMAKI